MILVNLKGGLGNQMFQYACGRALSLRTGNFNLKLNTFGLEKANEVGDLYRPFSLSHFGIKASVATQEEVRKVANPWGIVSKILRHVKNKYIYGFYINFVPNVLNQRGNVYLDGYFQSEKYFIDYEKEIREDFKPIELSEGAKVWLQKISEDSGSTSLHVRRGDYVTHKTLGNICTKEYYNRAIKKISEQVDNPSFFIFSDDIEWVRSNLNLPPDAEYVSSQELADYEELIIMSSCGHNIIANSSFSWWGAWLNPNPKKMVLAPARWAHRPESMLTNRDIVPESWVKISTE